MSAELTSATPVELATLTWTEARSVLAPDTIVIIPTGAIEAHGPHLPLDTDVIIADEMARRAAVRLAARGTSVVIAPSLVYGVSYAGTSFPGTTPVPADVLSDQLVEIVTNLARWGPRRFAIANAHLEPVHVASLNAGVDRAAAATTAGVAFPDQRDDRWAATLSDEFRRGARHAGAYETSLVLAARPAAVRVDLLPTLPPVWVDLPGRLKAGAKTFTEAGGVDGYFGDPASASAAEGERLFKALEAMIVAAIDELPAPATGR